ncbi:MULTISPECIES: cardiolipin synthase [Psychrilyobacter]|uniref:Cardiolipin synthase n=1 Tax=Psychrilyobacter piezotolerans TaxID=2293438 RepID=A0ABX9KJD5_9FUSO|nr:MULTISPECIES: cardiolipin synthase [Psychrilyobacter]MCS5421222.1 cardiolipin synthase [Psychrilyobacter sp. S5]NDI77021.1 cardiolipin synthase [Psychrilyobacter piezotolerans]RDE64638.1 cardiolipin synthase [Psychrilyobacter sp. S5]REI42450.1 cardiolipin synthase [Psychrilyobacter piezotolerans]
MNNVFTAVYILNIIFIIIIIFFEKRKNTSTIIWILILSLTNIFGFILYLFFGLSLRKRRFTRKYYKRFSFDKKKFKEDTVSDTSSHPHNNLIQLFNVKNHAYLRTKNDIKIYTHGEDCFKDLIAAISSAEKYIHMEYFIFENDGIGNVIMDLLINKVKNGVEVKLIYDGMGCIHVFNSFFQRLQDAGGEVLNFFPPLFSRFGLRANYRTHRKIVLVDGKYGFLGGMNIGDEYLGKNKKFGYWRDTHLRIKGSGVLGLEKSFLINLDFMREQKSFFKRRKKKLNHSIDDYLHFEKSSGHSDLQIVSSGPDYEEPFIKNGIFKMITGAKKNIYIQTPYFIPDETILNALEIAVMGGIEVNIMIPSKPDHFFVYWATLSYIGDLVKLGARCYTYDNGFLHSKVVIVDDEICTVGSANMDIRSFLLNFEINVFVYDPEIALQLKAAFLEDIKSSTLITSKKYKKRSFIIRFKESISKLLSPIM